MSEQTVIDSLKFAREKGELRDKIPVSALRRLADYLYDDVGVIEYALIGAVNAENQPILRLDITGSLNLVCQRCLGLLAYQLDLSKTLLLVENEKDLGDVAEEDESIDAILADPRMEVPLLIEEEIMLSLPISPKHQSGQCKPRSDEINLGKPASPSTFAALATLKK